VPATDYSGAVERDGGFAPGTLSGRIAERWADRLRYAGIAPAVIRHESSALNARVRAGAQTSADWAELVPLTSRIMAAHKDSAAPEFPLDLAHMHVNRIGLNPLEECLAAHLSATSTATDHHSRRHLP